MSYEFLNWLWYRWNPILLLDNAMLIASCCFSIQQCHEMPWIEFLSRSIWHLAVFFFLRVGVVTLILFLQIGVNKPKCEMYDTLSCAICNSVEPPPMTTSLVVDTTNNKTCCSSHFFSQASKKKSTPEVFPPTGQRSVITVTSVIGHIFQLEFDGELSSETWDIEIDGWCRCDA